MLAQAEKSKQLSGKLKKDDESVLFGEETLHNNLFRKIKTSKYIKDKEFVNLIIKLENRNDMFERDVVPIKTTFVKQKSQIDRSTLYSFDGPFQLLHADVATLEFLGKSAVYPKYCLLFDDLFTSKVYTYPMKSRRFIARKMRDFYEVKKRKNKPMRLQTDQKFIQNEIKNLNKKYNVQLFSTNVRGRKPFAAELKIRELKK